MVHHLLRALVAADPTQVFKNLSNATEDLARAFGEKLNPALCWNKRLQKRLNRFNYCGQASFCHSPIGQRSCVAIFTAIAIASQKELLFFCQF